MTEHEAGSLKSLPSSVRRSAELLVSRYVEEEGSLSPPINVLSLAKIAGARVVDGDHDLAGLTLQSASGHVISLGRKSRIAQTRLTRRARFTLAHEIGHVIVDSARSPEDDLSFATGQTVETICNKLAENLLMPDSVMNELFVLKLHDEVTIENIFELARVFDVSVEAVARRLSSLDLLKGARILGWRYARPRQKKWGELTCAWIVGDAWDHQNARLLNSGRESCALRAFRTATMQVGTESVSIDHQIVTSRAVAAPHGRFWVVEVLTPSAIPAQRDQSSPEDEPATE